MSAPYRARLGLPDWLAVTAPARLHMGFIDLHGGLGRRFGSLGMALAQPHSKVLMRRAARSHASGPDSARALRYAEDLMTQLGLPGGIELSVEQALPAHAGLGSGTQLALAVGAGIARLFELDLSAAEVATRLARGARSGVGVGAFVQGGFLVDGGHGAGSTLPPLIARLPVPPAWRVLLLFDDTLLGVHGATEYQAFARLPEFSAAAAGELSRLVLLQVLPALAEGDISAFGAGISAIQRQVGEYFAPLQGGACFTSPAVATALGWLTEHGAYGVGQSSWGPTGFALCADSEQGQRLLKQLTHHPHHGARLRCSLTQPRNHPATLERVRI